METTALALLSTLGGATLAAIAGLLGAWIQGRREHRRWVREKRFEAYTALLRGLLRLQAYFLEERRIQGEIADMNARGAGAQETERMNAAAARHRAALGALTQGIEDSIVPFTILVPHSVEGWLSSLGDAISDGDEREFSLLHDEVVRQMKKSLGLQARSWRLSAPRWWTNWLHDRAIRREFSRVRVQR